MRVLQPPATFRNALILPYKEEAAGSNQHRPLIKSAVLQVKRNAQERAPAMLEPFVQQPCSNVGLLRESYLHSPRSLVTMLGKTCE